MPAWIVQHCRCNCSSHVLNRNGFTRKRAATVVNLHFSLRNFFFNILIRKDYCNTFQICFIVFLHLMNIYTNTKITKTGAFIAKLRENPVFRAAILNFELLAGKPRATGWVPHFLIQHTQKKKQKKKPRYKFLCFYPKVHANFTYPPY